MPSSSTPSSGSRPGDTSASRPIDGAPQGDDLRFDRTLRPQTFADYIGQTKHKDNLARLRRGGAPPRRAARPHPPLRPAGPRQDDARAHPRARDGRPAPQHERPRRRAQGGARGAAHASSQTNDILFIDEIHRLNPVVEESLYPAMEDFRIDIMTGEGAFAARHPDPAPALHPRRRHHAHRAPHRAALLALRPRRPPRLLSRRRPRPHRHAQRAAARGRRSTRRAADEIARRSRGTPRIANRLLRRVRDFAEVLGTGKVDVAIVREGLRAARDRRRPASTRWTAAPARHHRPLRRGPGRGRDARRRLGEPRDTIEDVVRAVSCSSRGTSAGPRGAASRTEEGVRRTSASGVMPEGRQGGLFE